MSMSITAIHGRQILDSRGNPTVEVDVELEDGILSRSFALEPPGEAAWSVLALLRSLTPSQRGAPRAPLPAGEARRAPPPEARRRAARVPRAGPTLREARGALPVELAAGVHVHVNVQGNAAPVSFSVQASPHVAPLPGWLRPSPY